MSTTARRLIFLLVLSLALVAARAGPAAAERAPLILVSIDGFRADYLERGFSPNLKALAAGGVSAVRMIPSFPSVTFPNHYALVTGLTPDHNGIVANRFEDPRRPGAVFTMASQDPFWWDEATPIWITAERQGIRAGLMFWPGSEVAFGGLRASYWAPYDKALPADARVDRVLGWLDLPPDRRPGFLTLYFEPVDTMGHLHGPGSAEVDQAIATVDAAIGRLLAGLRARGIAANLIVVSDHGMAEVAPERTIVLDSLIDVGAVHVVFQDAVAGIDIPPTPQGAAARAALLAPHDHMTCWNRAQIPARLRYGSNPRVPDVVCAAAVGWLIETRASLARRALPLRGEHGYDPEAPEMAALFIASGPAFRHGLQVPPFPNVDVYPLMADVLGVTPRPNDGRLSDLKPILQP